MIYSDTIETVYSNVIGIGISSEEDHDYRYLLVYRETDDGLPRITENDELRILEK